jgi:hypothetical protein
LKEIFFLFIICFLMLETCLQANREYALIKMPVKIPIIIRTLKLVSFLLQSDIFSLNQKSLKFDLIIWQSFKIIYFCSPKVFAQALKVKG